MLRRSLIYGEDVMDTAYEIVTARIAEQKQNRNAKYELQTAENRGAKAADNTVSLIKWSELHRIATETVLVLAEYSYPGGWPSEVVEGYTPQKTLFGRRYHVRSRKNVVLWEMTEQCKSNMHGWFYLSLGSDGNMYYRVYPNESYKPKNRNHYFSADYHVVDESMFTNPDELAKVTAYLYELQSRARDGHLS